MLNDHSGYTQEAIMIPRMVSPVLAQLPWISQVVQTTATIAQLEKDVPGFSSFFHSLEKYEARLFTIRGVKERTAEMQDLLGVGIDQEGNLTPRNVVQRHSSLRSGRLCCLLSAYRLLDVVVWVGTDVRNSIRFFKTPLPPSVSVQFMEKLFNWPRLLVDFKHTFRATAAAFRASTPAPQPSVTTAHLRLLEFVVQNNGTKTYSKIVCNFLIAAMHLAYMKEVEFNDEVLPDLPDKLEEILRRPKQTVADGGVLAGIQTFLQENAEVKNGSKGDTVSPFRLPLQLALAISPLFLLVPFQIIKRKFNRQHIMDTAICLGNVKPRVLLEVETALWKALFALADKGGSPLPFTILENFLNNVPWSQIEEAEKDESVSSWFNLAVDRISRAAVPPSSANSDSNLELLKCPIPAGVPCSAGGDPSSMEVESQSDRTNFSEASKWDSPFAAGVGRRSRAVLSSDTPRTIKGDSDPKHDQAAFTIATDVTPKQPTAFKSLTHAELESTTTVLRSIQPLAEELQRDGTREQQEQAIKAKRALEEECVDREQHVVPAQSEELAVGRDLADDESVEDEQRAYVDPIPLASRRGYSSSDEGAIIVDDIQPTRIRATTSLSSSTDEMDVDDLEHTEGSSTLSSDEDLSVLTPPRRLSIRIPGIKPQKEFVKTVRVIAPSPQCAPSTLGGFSGTGARYDPLVLLEGDSDPVDVSAFHKPRDVDPALESGQSSKMTSPTVYTAFNAVGNQLQFSVMAHHQQYLDQFERLLTHLKRTGFAKEPETSSLRPLHIVDPDRSSLRILNKAEFKEMPPSKVQALLHTKNIIVRGAKADPIPFNESGLKQIHSLHGPISLQAPSTPSLVTGTLKHILDNAMRVDGKILNGPEFPSSCAAEPSSISTDKSAWQEAFGHFNCGLNDPYPSSKLSFALVGTAHTFTPLHLDSDGLNTWVHIECGKKLWVFYAEQSALPLSSTNVFLDPGFQLNDIGSATPPKYGFEGVILEAGDTLYMRSNTPHFVYGLENTVCRGGRYYATSLMQRTSQGLIHAFIANNFIANTAHVESRQLLRRIALFYHLGLVQRVINLNDAAYTHLPNVDTMEGLLDLLSLCNLVISGNVLDIRTYNAPNQLENAPPTPAQLNMIDYDHNGIPKKRAPR